MDAAVESRKSLRRMQWGALLLYLATIGLLYINSSPLGFAEGWQLVVQLVLLAPVIAAVVLRVRMPFALPLLGLTAIVSGTFSVFMVGAMSLAIRRRGPWVWSIATVGGLLASAVIAYRDTLAGATPVGVALGVPLTVVIVGVAPTLVGQYIRRRREFAEAAAEQAVRAEVERELAAQRAVHTERERIAQEMHDSLGHVLALVTMQAGALEVNAKEATVVSAAEQIRETARSGLAELRAVVRALGADARRDPAPALSTIPQLVEASRAAGAEVTLRDELDAGGAGVPSSTGRVIYQAVQESLTNAHRHAPGAPVEIVLSGAPGAGIEVRVSNPLTPGGERGAGTGLASLRSRVEVLGGTAEARALQGRFDLRVRLPWEENA